MNILQLKTLTGMKKFWSYFNDFHKGYYNPVMYVLVALFITSLIVFNYKFDFEDSYIDKYYGKSIRILFYFLYHALAYYGVLLLIWLSDKSKISFSRQFWLKSILGLLILGTDRAIFPFISKILLNDLPAATYRFYFKILFNSYGLVTIGVSLLVMKLIFDGKSNDGLYGLRLKELSFKSYWILLALMVPILFMATYLPDIQAYYPTYKRTGGARFASYHNISEWVSIVFYESIYLMDFLNTELYFRGFLIIGLSRLMGKNVVLPMAACYAVLHFGKPLGETISSVFGAYILGVIALYSRNIWGGVFIHGGIALLMELFAFWR